MHSCAYKIFAKLAKSFEKSHKSEKNADNVCFFLAFVIKNVKKQPFPGLMHESNPEP